MSDEMLSPLIGSGLRVQDREQLEEFMSRPDAAEVIKGASFEEVFFLVRHIGLADCMELLPLITSKQVRGFIDLDCWQKDTFVEKPLMEWVAAFIQAGPEQTVRALAGIDEQVLALFLKDIVKVYEVDRDDPPEGTQMIFTPDNRFGVEPVEDGEATTIGMLILDALFKYYPALGSRVLACARYTTRAELEENAFQNKVGRLEAHGFVDYYEAMSIYSGPEPFETPAAADRESNREAMAGEEHPGHLPALFADSLMGGTFLMKAFGFVTDPSEADRLAEQLTALGNRILSANLINLGEVEGVRPALEEMKDFLTIGLEYLTGRHAERGPEILRKSYMQTVFKIGFGQVSLLRDSADRLSLIPGFGAEMLDTEDREFVQALRRFKPVLFTEGGFRNFRTLTDVEAAQARLDGLHGMVASFLASFGEIRHTLGRTFNTATVAFAIHSRFEPHPIKAAELEEWLNSGFRLPEVEVPPAIQPFVQRWWAELKEELEPLVGRKIDPRFIASLVVQF